MVYTACTADRQMDGQTEGRTDGRTFSHAGHRYPSESQSGIPWIGCAELGWDITIDCICDGFIVTYYFALSA